METFNFSKALEHLKSKGIAKRQKSKNDTVIVMHKKRLYQMSESTGVRYSYTPSNSDLMADDWLLANQVPLTKEHLLAGGFKETEEGLYKHGVFEIDLHIDSFSLFINDMCVFNNKNRYLSDLQDVFLILKGEKLKIDLMADDCLLGINDEPFLNKDGNQICNKSNELCLHKCNGLCREGC